MRNLKNSYPIFIVFALLSFNLAQEKDIIGYYPSWSWKNRNNLVDQNSIPYKKLTIINYAFFVPLSDGTIVGKDPEADNYLLKGIVDSLSDKKSPNTTLIDMAHGHNVKVLLSIGGWGDSDNFPEVAGDIAKRNNFARWCVKYIKEYGFDGIDIDWEYPGYIPHSGTAEDKTNFTLLLLTVRDSLELVGKQMGKYYLLSAALPASIVHTKNIEVKKVAEILDFLNIMTYDFFGPWEAVSNHNSPLYAATAGDVKNNVDGAFKLYHETYAIPAVKINLGVPFYGHTFADCAKLHGKHKGGAVGLFPEAGNATYYEIIENISSFKKYWDQSAQVPYLISKDKKIFISYDDEKSIGMKADYVLENDARGLIIWHIMGDYFQNRKTPLLDVIFNKFYGSKIEP